MTTNFTFVWFYSLIVRFFYFPALKDHQHQLRGVRGKVAGSPGWPTHKVLNVDEDGDEEDGNVGGVDNDGEVMPLLKMVFPNREVGGRGTAGLTHTAIGAFFTCLNLQ